jgi:tetratricopeptide (TPR) repeat protein
MDSRFNLSRLAGMAALAVALGVGAGTSCAHAQSKPQVPQIEPPAQPAQPPAKLPRPAVGDRMKNLDFLFEALKVAPDDDSARLVESRIWALWYASGSDTADLLMSRVKTALEKKDVDLALQLLDALVALKPDYVEAWNRRATIYFSKKDYAHALADLRQVLAREPRHFAALSGLGLILQETGQEKRALEVYRRALAINPHLQKIPDVVKTLTEKVEGRDI